MKGTIKPPKAQLLATPLPVPHFYESYASELFLGCQQCFIGLPEEVVESEWLPYRRASRWTTTWLGVVSVLPFDNVTWEAIKTHASHTCVLPSPVSGWDTTWSFR